MKKLMILLAMVLAVAILIGTAMADSCILQVNLTRAFQVELYQQRRHAELADFESIFAPEDVPINMKIKEFNTILKGRKFEIISGDMIHDYIVVVKLIDCEQNE